MFKVDECVPNRVGLASLLLRNGLRGHAVEVGVWRGDFSDPFIEAWQGECLHLVDPWCKLPDNEYVDIRNRDFDPDDFLHVQQRMSKFGNRVQFHRMLSHEAAFVVPDGLDFVYIDANHEYGHVVQDLGLWWCKLKVGGTLAGHDLFSLEHIGVTEALTYFAFELCLTINVIQGDFDKHGKLVCEHSWYVVKE